MQAVRDEAQASSVPLLVPFGWQRGKLGFVEYDGLSRVGEYSEGTARATGRKLFALAHGGQRSGKTYGGALKALIYNIHWPGARGMIVAPTHDMLREATLPTLFDLFHLSGMQPTVHYDYIKHDKVVKLWHGGWISLASAEEPQRLAGRTLAWEWLDEAGQMSFEVFKETAARLSQPGYPLQMWVTTTPNDLGPEHWIYQVWFPEEYRLRMGEDVKFAVSQDVDEYKDWVAVTKDNPHGGQAAHDTMVRVLGGEGSPLVRQLLYGEFVQREGLVFPTFSRVRHVRAREDWPVDYLKDPPTIVVAGVDFGFTNPLAVGILLYYDGFPYWILAEEYVGHRQDFRQVRELALEIQRKWRPRVWVCDEADPGRIRDLRYTLSEYETQVVATRKRKWGSTQGSIAYVTGVLNSETEGRAGFIVDPSCRHFVHQMESYVEAKQKEGQDPSENPKEHHNDMVAAVRYGLSWLCRHFPDKNTAQAWQTRIVPYAGRRRRG